MAKGQKTCPSCQAKVGPRTKVCSCGHQFLIGQKTNTPTKLKSTGRGRKTCPKCQAIYGVRTKKCVCGHKFQFTPNCLKEKRIQVDWRELQKGEHIRVITGSGPYIISKDEDGNKIKHNIGYYGIFRVHLVDKNGIHAYPVSKHESGHCYIYMGPKYKTEHNIIKKKHKIVKVKKKVRDNV